MFNFLSAFHLFNLFMPYRCKQTGYQEIGRKNTEYLDMSCSFRIIVKLMSSYECDIGI